MNNADADANKSMIANLFLQGKPVTLNYQLMETRLKRPRLVPSQRAEYNRQLLSEGGFLTIADNEKDEPLLIHFRSEDDRYTLRVATPGKFYGYFLSMEKIRDAHGGEVSAGNLVVLEKGNPTRFYLDTVSPGVERLMNVGRKSVVNVSAGGEGEGDLVASMTAHNEIKGPTYLYKSDGKLVNEEQRYFSDSFFRAEHVIWDPKPEHFTVQVKGWGVLELSDIG